MYRLLLCCACLAAAAPTGNSPVPLVIWHGMGRRRASRVFFFFFLVEMLCACASNQGDTCCDGLTYLKHWLENEIPGIYIKSLQFGNSLFMDRWTSFFSSVNVQVEMACDELGLDPKLHEGFNALGFSQGGQFL